MKLDRHRTAKPYSYPFAGNQYFSFAQKIERTTLYLCISKSIRGTYIPILVTQLKGARLELREIQEIYILQYYMKRSTLRTEDWKSKALLQLLLLHWRVKRNPVKNVDNLFPTTKGKNIVCLFKKNVTTWQLGVRVEEKRNGRERKVFFYLIPDTCKPNDDFVHLHHLKNVERACVIWAPFDVWL